MKLVFYPVALGIVIKNLDDLLAPFTTGCLFPTFAECVNAGVLRARRVDKGYLLEMSLMELMAINDTVKILRYGLYAIRLNTGGKTLHFGVRP